MLYLVRHGESTLNAAGIKHGRMDPPLTLNGERQALTTALALTGERVAGIVSSPQIRALHYAQLLAHLLGTRPPRVMAALAERSFGAAEGHTPEHIAATWPDGPPGMESYEQAAERALRALAGLPDRTVVVTHSGVIRGLTGRKSVGNGEIIQFGGSCFTSPSSATTADSNAPNN